jgi:hypothetical protein
MKLSIISYNKLNIFRKLYIGFILISLLLVILLKKYNITINPTIVLSILLPVSFSGIMVFYFPNYKKNGTIILNGDGKCVIIIDNIENRITINNLTFYYGGYKGEDYPLWYPAFFAKLKSGAQNYLLINNRKFRILIENKEQWNTLSSIIENIKNSGISSQSIKMSIPEILKSKKHFNV